MIIALFMVLIPTVLDVGDGKAFARIEDAVRASHPGDEIRVFPKAVGYVRSAVLIRTPGLKIVGQGRVKIDGSGFEYSGAGSVPRAIFQVEPGADGVEIDNFELVGASNASHNGAGLRINAANHCTMRNCSVHGNNMGVMSAGSVGDNLAASDQLIDHCEIYENGDFGDPGYNHNLYLGGTSATVQFCDIHDALTGHNLKSRAHYTLVQYCSIHDSANREMDFVDAWDTERPYSNVVLIGNVIRKSKAAKGNRTVIHFGIEQGKRDGTIYLIHNDIVTPFVSPVVQISSPMTSAQLFSNQIECVGQSHPVLVDGLARGSRNVISPNYDLSRYRFGTGASFFVDGTGAHRRGIPLYRYSHGAWKPTTDQFVGAG